MMTCREVTELVTAYLERRLSLRDRLRFQLHLGLCHHCRRYLRQMRLTVASVGKLPKEPIPDALREELLRRFRDWKS